MAHMFVSLDQKDLCMRKNGKIQTRIKISRINKQMCKTTSKKKQRQKKIVM